MKISFYAAMELPEMMSTFLSNVSKKILQSDEWQPIDSYVQLTYNNTQVKTKHKNGTCPIWNEAIHLTSSFPSPMRTMNITLKDHSNLQRDRTIATFNIDQVLISETNPAIGFLPTFGPTWIFLYGNSRLNYIDDVENSLGQVTSEGLCYSGRLLMEIQSSPLNQDTMTTIKLDKQTDIQPLERVPLIQSSDSYIHVTFCFFTAFSLIFRWNERFSYLVASTMFQ